jgi:spore germination cell wall hydrolase CwlJ-like protein
MGCKTENPTFAIREYGNKAVHYGSGNPFGHTGDRKLASSITEQWGSAVLTTAALCMALNVYWEARSEPIEGQYAVAQVTFNRARHDPDIVCSVVFKRKQFSWANRLTEVSGDERTRRAKRYVPADERAWKTAKEVAVDTLSGKSKNIVGDATFYHSHKVSPAWAKHMQFVKTVGNHKFYYFDKSTLIYN